MRKHTVNRALYLVYRLLPVSADCLHIRRRRKNKSFQCIQVDTHRWADHPCPTSSWQWTCHIRTRCTACLTCLREAWINLF